MEFIETGLNGAYLVQLKKIEDERGYFARAWCRDEFLKHGLNSQILQLNVGFNKLRGTVRGMHFQLPPHSEAKFVRCTRGAIFDVMIDLREDSPTFGRWFGQELTPANGLLLYLPEGFAHGYQALCDDTEMYYQTSEIYQPSAARGVRFDDPAFAIKWPMPISLVSAADRGWPLFNGRSGMTTNTSGNAAKLTGVSK